MIPVLIFKLVQYTSFKKKTGLKKLVFLKNQFFQTSLIFNTSFKKPVLDQNWLKTKLFTGFFLINELMHTFIKRQHAYTTIIELIIIINVKYD